MLLQNEFLKIAVTDRQKDGHRQTYGRTDVHQDTQTHGREDRNEARQTRQKQGHEAEDNRRASRDRTGDKEGGAVWCRLRRVLLRWWVDGVRVAMLVVMCGCVLLVLLCGCVCCCSCCVVIGFGIEIKQILNEKEVYILVYSINLCQFNLCANKLDWTLGMIN